MSHESTTLRFRHLLKNYDLVVSVFAEVRDVLLEKGLSMKRGTMVDATLTVAPSSTTNEDKKRDQEMTQSKKSADGELNEKQKAFNWMPSSVRAIVKHPFCVIKRQFDFVTVRYRGLAKNIGRIVTLFFLEAITGLTGLQHFLSATYFRMNSARKKFSGIQTLMATSLLAMMSG